MANNQLPISKFTSAPIAGKPVESANAKGHLEIGSWLLVIGSSVYIFSFLLFPFNFAFTSLPLYPHWNHNKYGLNP